MGKTTGFMEYQREVPSDRLPEEAPPIEFYVEKLKNFGHEVANATDDQLDVKAPEDEIFELLSGQHIYL